MWHHKLVERQLLPGSKHWLLLCIFPVQLCPKFALSQLSRQPISMTQLLFERKVTFLYLQRSGCEFDTYGRLWFETKLVASESGK